MGGPMRARGDQRREGREKGVRSASCAIVTKVVDGERWMYAARGEGFSCETCA